MILDPKAISVGAMYRFMISVVVPRPIAFVSTVNREGRFNAAPFSYFTALTSDPPLIAISISLRSGGPKDTLRNIRETGDFVVNAATEEMAGRIVQASGDWPEEVDELALTGLTPAPADLVRSPRVAESPVNLECRFDREIELGRAFLVVGEIVRAHVSDTVLTEGRVDIAKLKPLGRLGGDGYTAVREDFHLPRPRVRPGEGGGAPGPERRGRE
jgi:flavin reductase (DIM6/NTAB) family NADH-FMN oxidoreductase RutF